MPGDVATSLQSIRRDTGKILSGDVMNDLSSRRSAPFLNLIKISNNVAVVQRIFNLITGAGNVNIGGRDQQLTTLCVRTQSRGPTWDKYKE